MLLWISFADVSLKFLKGHWIRWEAADATHAFSSPINGSVHQLVLRHDHETIEWDSRFQRSNDFDAIMTSDQCHESPRPKLWGFGKTHIPRWLTSARGWFLEMLTQVGIKRNSLVGVGWRTVVQWFSYIFTFFFNESNWNLKSRHQETSYQGIPGLSHQGSPFAHTFCTKDKMHGCSDDLQDSQQSNDLTK